MVLRFCGNIMSDRFLQPEKAYSLIFVTVLGIVTDVIEVLLKAEE